MSFIRGTGMHTVALKPRGAVWPACSGPPHCSAHIPTVTRRQPRDSLHSSSLEIVRPLLERSHIDPCAAAQRNSWHQLLCKRMHMLQPGCKAAVLDEPL